MKIRLILFLLSLSLGLSSQNVMNLSDISGNAGDIVTLSLEIDNSDDFVAFEFEITLPDELSFVPSSEILSARSSDHQISAAMLSGNVLKLFAYSLTQATFSGTTGSVCTFELELGNIPGNYALALDKTVIGDSISQNILTSSLNGTVTLIAPDINLSTSLLNYDRVALQQYSDLSFTIYNQGNSDLNISGITTSYSDFEIIGNTSMIITAGNSTSITVRFNSTTKGTFDEELTIESDDPDENTSVINLHAIAFAVNELHLNNMFGRSGYESTLTIDISNMEAFVGFSFDIQIPEAMTYVPNSASLLGRETNHVVSATTLENGNVRVVSYSPTNASYTGNEGNILSLDFLIDGIGGWYGVSFIDPIIGDSSQQNILSDSYNASLEIASPDISLSTNLLDFGEVSIFDTSEMSMQVNNYGSDTLIIDTITFFDSEFYSDAQWPISVAPNNNVEIPVFFHSAIDGEFISSAWIRSNDADEDPTTIQLQGQAFIPNIMRVDSTFIQPTDSGWVSISIENNEAFVGFQFDLIIADGFNYLDEVQLSSRANNHIVSSSLIGTDTLRVFAYSMLQAEFSGNSGSIISIKFEAPSVEGEYFFNISNVVIGNSNSENIASSFEGGFVYVYPAPLPTAVLSGSATLCDGDSSQISIALTGTAPWIITYTDGTISTTDTTSVSPYTFTVFTEGTYEVTAVSDYYNEGTESTGQAIITINPIPVANFTSEANVLEVTFSNTSSNASSYLWDFGDGSSSIEENPIYTYSSSGEYTVVLTAYSDFCGEATDTLTISIVTGINSLEFEEVVRVYPNPTKGTINIDLGTLTCISVNVHSLDGKIIYQLRDITGPIIQFELNEPTGIYFVEVKSEKGIKLHKLVIH